MKNIWLIGYLREEEEEIELKWDEDTGKIYREDNKRILGENIFNRTTAEIYLEEQYENYELL